MRRRRTARAEIGRRGRERFAKVMHPHTVDEHARRERIRRRDNRPGQVQPPAAALERARFAAAEHARKSPRHRLARTRRAPALEDVRLIRLRQIGHYHSACRRRVGGIGREFVQTRHQRIVAVFLRARHVIGRVPAREPDGAVLTGDEFQQLTLIGVQPPIGAAGRWLFRFFINLPQQLAVGASHRGFVRQTGLAQRAEDKRIAAIGPAGRLSCSSSG